MDILYDVVQRGIEDGRRRRRNDRKDSQQDSNDPQPIPKEKRDVRIGSDSHVKQGVTYIFLLNLGLETETDK